MLIRRIITAENSFRGSEAIKTYLLRIFQGAARRACRCGDWKMEIIGRRVLFRWSWEGVSADLSGHFLQVSVVIVVLEYYQH